MRNPTTKETIKKNPNDKILDLFNSSIIKQTSYKGIELKGLLSEVKLMQRLYYLNNLDVCRYYELKEYDTDLKRKTFKNTSEGQRNKKYQNQNCIIYSP